MCCSAGQFCGPCCSVRGWFVTHVVFATLAVIGAVGAGVQQIEGQTQLPEEQRNLLSAIITFVMAVLFIFYAIVGWAALCKRADGMKFVFIYVVLTAIFTILQLLALVIAFVNGNYTEASFLIMIAFNIAIIFFYCQHKERMISLD